MTALEQPATMTGQTDAQRAAARRAHLKHLAPRVAEARRLLPPGDRELRIIEGYDLAGDPVGLEQALNNAAAWIDSYRADASTRAHLQAEQRIQDQEALAGLPAHLRAAIETAAADEAARRAEFGQAAAERKRLAGSRPTSASADLAYAQQLAAAEAVVTLRSERLREAQERSASVRAAVAAHLDQHRQAAITAAEQQIKNLTAQRDRELNRVEAERRRILTDYGQQITEAQASCARLSRLP